MKRYLIFAYRTYYPSGGMDDFIKSIDFLIDTELKEILLMLKEDNDQFQIYDSLLNKFEIKETYISDYLKH
jgi:hypothetical protein